MKDAEHPGRHLKRENERDWHGRYRYVDKEVWKQNQESGSYKYSMKEEQNSLRERVRQGRFQSWRPHQRHRSIIWEKSICCYVSKSCNLNAWKEKLTAEVRWLIDPFRIIMPINMANTPIMEEIKRHTDDPKQRRHLQTVLWTIK